MRHSFGMKLKRGLKQRDRSSECGQLLLEQAAAAAVKRSWGKSNAQASLVKAQVEVLNAFEQSVQ